MVIGSQATISKSQLISLSIGIEAVDIFKLLASEWLSNLFVVFKNTVKLKGYGRRNFIVWCIIRASGCKQLICRSDHPILCFNGCEVNKSTGQTNEDSYILANIISRGSYSTIYEAIRKVSYHLCRRELVKLTCQDNANKVAIKIMSLSDMSDQDRQRLSDEIKILSFIGERSNIINVQDIFVRDREVRTHRRHSCNFIKHQIWCLDLDSDRVHSRDGLVYYSWWENILHREKS